MTSVKVGRDISIGRGHPLCLIAGPCVIETDEIALETADRLARIAQALSLPLIYKSSFEKDNRTTVDGYRGPGLERGLAVLQRVRETTGLPVISDVHREADVAAASELLDVVQVPAFLSRQTSLLLEMGRHARVVNIKKGQFMAPQDIGSSVDKVRAGGCQNVLLTERGSCFGYNNLVADMTAIPLMQDTGCPVVFDAGHVVRRYGIPSSDPAGGAPRFIPTLCRAAVAAGCDALFVETHPNPGEALCDAASQLPLDELEGVLRTILPIAHAVRGAPP
jgi:2-dehydro-3-deoxyphosphooctonate aldolase (KDO 8-P synthase)